MSMPRLLDLPEAIGLAVLGRLPWVHRILIENLLRRSAGDPAAMATLDRWLADGGSDAEIPFYPARIMMHDTTCVPALVDLAAARDAVAAAGGDPRALDPVVPVDVSTDHSIAVDHFGTRDAMRRNLAREAARNGERFRLMKWADRSMASLTVHPPGTGIMHTLNLERLASVVTVERRDGEEWLIPDTLIGTDSHTPMINGIGVLGWGVGGLEAEAAMLGAPVMLRVPRVVGVELTGALGECVLATDLALAVTHRLRQVDLANRFVEFFGPGVAALSAGERAVVANMAPEYGATTAFFPIDQHTLDYLHATGRDPAAIDRVRDYAQTQSLWFDPAARPAYDLVIAIDLSAVTPSVAGPSRPQDLLSLDRIAAMLPAPAPQTDPVIPHGAVAIAAITSCTNTSDPRLLIAAGLLAQRARRAGLTTKPWVKTSLAPGSPSAAGLLKRAGLLEDLEALGFAIVGIGCTTCIGNSGPLVPAMRDAIERGAAAPVAILSGNRNFPGRVHADIQASFLASPPLVIAFALRGDATGDVARDPVGTGKDGTPVYLADLWPSGAEIDAALALAADRGDVQHAFDLAEQNPAWRDLDAPSGPLFDWDPASTYLRPPPFAGAGAHRVPQSMRLHPLLVLGDDITTDHISPAGAIPSGSDAAGWLVDRGADPADLNVYASRRGNWEVMLRGLFTNPAVRNLLADDLPAGWTIHAPSGDRLPLWQAAQAYAAASEPLAIVAGDRYGMGSSRDWAAKGAWLLGVRAVIASSFERIHRSNLINLAILPVEVPRETALALRKLRPGDRLAIDLSAPLSPRGALPVALHCADGSIQPIPARAAIETQSEVAMLMDGGLLPALVSRLIGAR
ncbi:aconitate hydratase AcnA [Sphingomonas alpina]|uniref:Aconitate hydratase A n=2 Tax=Sphingomonas alpina TaxID=653931 RepID=A0A7H0LIV6_9SPHN|nr:aconitate hydratase AcnA [Sphingomonas alpina]QNQ09609.1 aconitate hydratase AcnA [Sphingomonas alpina]